VQKQRDADGHRRVRVVPAEVRHAVRARVVRDALGVLDRQRVDVGAVADARRPAVRGAVPAADVDPEARFGDGAVHLEAVAFERLAEEAARGPLLHPDLGVPVQVSAHRDEQLRERRVLAGGDPVERELLLRLVEKRGGRHGAERGASETERRAAFFYTRAPGA
jgi:hypothetical protein